MKMSIPRKLAELDRSLQQLKVQFVLGKGSPKKAGLYNEREIVAEVRKVRKQLWNERYAKKVKGLS